MSSLEYDKYLKLIPENMSILVIISSHNQLEIFRKFLRFINLNNQYPITV